MNKSDFTKGYICACATMVRIEGESTTATEVLGCNFISVQDLKKQGVEESDIEILMPVIKEIKRKRKLHNP